MRNLLFTIKISHTRLRFYTPQGARISMSIEGIDGWIVKPPVASAKLYEGDKPTVVVDRNHERACSVFMKGWTLPGIGAVIEWTPLVP